MATDDALPASAAESKVPEIEQDTAAAEDAYDLHELLLPDGRLSPAYHKFSVSYNQQALDGWVKQPSPCCAAAAVAGAYNALMGFSRNDENALTHTHVVETYKEMMAELIEQKKASFERMMGASLDPLLERVWAHKDGGGESGKKPSRASQLRRVRNIVKEVQLERAASASNQDQSTPDNESSGTATLEADIFDRLHEMYQEEQQAAAERGAADGEDATSVASEEEGEEELVVEQPKRSSDKLSSTAAWPWRDRLLEIFKKIAGLEKLSRPKPLTAPIGNWAVLDAVRRINDYPQRAPNTRLSAALFMGRGRKRTTKMPVVLTKDDDENEIQQQWEALRTEFLKPGHVLLFHLTNHYALVFALWEWEAPGGQKVRQLLTARKGQRPTAWIDFEEARQTMLGWEGYKMMSVSVHRFC